MIFSPSLDAHEVENFRAIAKLPVRPWSGKSPAKWVASLQVAFEDTNSLDNQAISRSNLIKLWRNFNVSTEACFLSTMAWGGMKAGHGRSIWQTRNDWIPLCEQLRIGAFPDRKEAFEQFRLLRRQGKLPGMGPAYFTKVLFFARPIQDAYILDQWTARSIHMLTKARFWPSVDIDTTTLRRMQNNDGKAREIRVNVTDRVTSSDYGHYCDLVEELGRRLQQTPCIIEETMFGQGGRNPTEWRSFIMNNWYDLPSKPLKIETNDLRDMLNNGRFHEFKNAILAQPTYAVSEPGLLIKAVNLSSKDCVDVLLEHGANPNPDSDSPVATGKSLLIMAIEFGEFDIARSLLAHGAEPYKGFQCAPDYGLHLSMYASSGLLTQAEYGALIDEIRAGNNPIARNIR